MKHLRIYVSLCLPLFCLLSLSCGQSAPAPSLPAAQAGTTGTQSLLVDVVPVRRQSIPEAVKVVGALAAERKAKIASEINGRITSVAVEEGESVKANDVVIRLDDHDLKMRVAAAEAELRAAQQRVGSADADVEIAGTDVSLTEAQAAEQVHVAQARLEQAKNDLHWTQEKVEGEIKLAKANLSIMQAKLRLVEAGARPQDKERAKADLDGAKASVASAEAYLQHTKRVRDRKSQAAAKGILPLQDAENAESDYQQALANLAFAQTQVRSLEQTVKLLEEGARREEKEQAQAEVQAAEESLRTVEKNRAQVAQKQQEVTAAEAELNRAQKTLDAAKRGQARVRKSQQDSQVARSAVSLAEVNLRLAREELNKTLIRSPIAGIVASREAEVGEPVFSMLTGRPLLEIVDPNSLYLEAMAQDRDVLIIHAGLRVDIHFEALKGKTYAGVARDILPPTDPQGRAFRVKIALTNKDRLLNVGMLATAVIHVGQHDNALLIPAAALLNDAPGAAEGEVFVVENEAARKRRVTLGARLGEQVAVTGGLSEGDMVVVEGQLILSDGQQVKANLKSN